MREGIPVIKILKDLKRAGFPIEFSMPKVMCNVFKEKIGTLEMATFHHHIAKTKHLNVKIHHFKDYVTPGEVTILPIRTLDQAYYYLTKVFDQSTRGRHR